ncbi:MAG: hypothetical protein ACRDHB_01955 [Actinomycetota bacterium]
MRHEAAIDLDRQERRTRPGPGLQLQESLAVRGCLERKRVAVSILLAGALDRQDRTAETTVPASSGAAPVQALIHFFYH